MAAYFELATPEAIRYNVAISTENSMRYFVFSDVHANLEAFDAVLSAAAEVDIDRIIFLGDIVGYGARPNEVVDRLRQLSPHAIVRGNHDKVVAGIEDGSDFQPVARMSAMWARRQMSTDNAAYLQRLPQGPMTLDEGIEISHGSPDDEDFYILSGRSARPILRRSRSWIMFYGHTHVPMIYSTESKFSQSYPESDDFCYALSQKSRYLINPGSVGQPRDLNPKASFAILDTGENRIQIRRIGYDIRAAQDSICEAGLPEWHANRLAIGR
ncbi:MAG: metallophosphoesterase family protein [Candidatus Poribacteria bacterium]|nr:metallophosphoesterase family protein [Candidatus Poribacteria bacterium]